MGRIHPIKGCDNLLKAFAEVTESNPNLHLIMAGPDVIGWVSTLQDLARSLGIEDKISWLGMLENDLKWGAFYASSCLILPSHTENFGMVVAEALACSTPVIITNKVNIWSYIQEEKAGFVSEDSTEGLTNSIKQWNDLNQTELEKLKQNANKCFEKHFELTKNTQELIKIIHEHLN